MPGSLHKYFEDRGGKESPHGDYLFWPGTRDGFPFRSSQPAAPLLQKSEYEQIPLVCDFHSGRFQVAEPEQKKLYDTIMDRIANGWYMLYKRHEHLDQTTGYLVIWLEWLQIYGEQARAKSPPLRPDFPEG